MNLNLRQIIRNQKTKNFDLISLISEKLTAADQAAKKGWKSAGGGGYWKDKNDNIVARTVDDKLVPVSSDDDTTDTGAPPSDGEEKPSSDNQIDLDPEGDDIDALGDEFNTDVDIDDDLRSRINSELESIGLTPSKDDENVFVDEDGKKLMMIDSNGEITPGEDIEDIKKSERQDYLDSLELVNDRLKGKEDGEEGEKKDADTERKPEEDDDWRSEKHNPEGEDGRPSPDQINDLRTQMFNGETGRTSDWAGKSDSTPVSKIPSDAMARTTAIDLGYPPGSTERGPSKITGQMSAPAPGNPGSMMNEVFSVEGCNIAESFYERFGVPPTVKEMEGILQEQFGNSQLAKDNDGPSGSKYREKLRISAEASLTKFDRLQNGLRNEENSEFGTMIRPPSQFYGAADSIEAQVNMIREVESPPNKIYGPAGPIEEINVTPEVKEELTSAIIDLAKNNEAEEWVDLSNGKKGDNRKASLTAVQEYVDELLSDPSNPEKIKKFVEILAHSSGGGANPGDTATFARSEDGNLMVLFHSDKMTRADQQTNSTMAAETRQQRDYIDNFADPNRPGGPVIDENQKKKALEIFDETEKELSEIKARDETPTVIKRILDLEGRKKEVALEAVIILAENRNPNPMDRAGTDNAEEYLKWLSQESETGGKNGEGRKITAEEGKTINRVYDLINGKPKDLASQLKHDLDPEEMLTIDATSINAEKTAETVRALDERRKKLDKIKTKIEGPDKKPKGLGQITDAQLIINQYHLYATNDPSSLAYQSGMCATVVGTDIVNRDTLRECLEVENTDELLGRLITEPPRRAEEDFVDKGVGVPNSMLQRSNTSYERDSDGSVYYFTVDGEGNIVGKTTDSKDPNIQRTKDKKPVRVGIATGLKISSTFMNKEGDRFMVAQKSGRTKGGPGSNLETTGVYGKQMQDCIGANGTASIHEEIISYKLGNILSETKQNTLGHHWKKAEDNYPVHYFIRELNEESLN